MLAPFFLEDLDHKAYPGDNGLISLFFKNIKFNALRLPPSI